MKYRHYVIVCSTAARVAGFLATCVLVSVFLTSCNQGTSSPPPPPPPQVLAADPGGPYRGNVGQTITFDGSKSTAPTGQTLTIYAWNFGDNSTGTGVSPTHVYSTAGTFTVSLTVTDTSGGTNSLSTNAIITALPAANPGGPYTGSVGQTITFDGSKSTAPAGQTLTYTWNFGDISTGTGVAPTHAYSTAGTFTVALTVTDTSGAANTLSTTATISALPVANPGGPYSGNVGQTITFDGSKSTAPTGQTLTYAWNFGDNATGTGVSPTHAYATAGTFTVALTVTDTSGAANSLSTTATISALPLANPGGPYSGNVGQTITFDGSTSTAPTGQTLTYAWNFGDNATGTGVSPTHAYSAVGIFTVALTVTDTSGGTNTNTTTATIGSGGAPSITSFTPTSGTIGTQVTITGVNLAPAPLVTLAQQGGGSIGASVVSSSLTSITFIVPAGAATGPISVAVGAQSTTSTNSFTVVASSSFTVNAAPNTVTVIQGQSAALSVALSSTNGFGQLAALGVSGLPTGITATFSPTQITAGQTSILTVTAPSGQPTGSSTLTVMATATVQGILQTPTAPPVTLNVQGVSTSFLGRTVVDDNRETPIADVTIKFLGVDDKSNATGCAGQTVSDAGGNFLFSSLPAACTGPQLISYDGSTATAPPGKYAGVNLSYTLTSGQVTTSPVLIHLPRIDNAETVNIQQNAPVDQVFTFQTIPSLRVTVYAGTTFSLDDGTQPNPFPLIAISIPTDRLPDMMPTSGMLTPFIVAFQPANAVASQPVAVNFPNPLNSPPGTAADFMTLDPTHGYMVPFGTGTVSPDGTQFIADQDTAHPGHRYGLVHFDWHGPRAPAPVPNLGENRAGDPVDLSTGQFVLNKTDIAMESARGTISIIRTYRSSTSNVGPFGVGTGHNYGYLLDTSSFVQGIGKVLTLVMPNGNQYPFPQQGPNTFASFAAPGVVGAVITSAESSGTYNLRWKDGTVYQFQTSSQGGLLAFLASITDPNGNVTTLVRGNSSQPSQITQIIDPVGRALTLTYDSSNRIVSITDPIGRQVQYTYNSLGGLATVTDPAGGVTTYTYAPTIPASALALDSITDPRGITYLKNSYIAFLVAQQTAADGGVTNYDFDGFIACTKIPNNRSGCFHEGPYFNASVTDPLGHHYSYHFNVQGFLQDVTDPLGQQTVYNRDSLTNELLSVTDPLGRTTGFTYDSSGNMTSLTQLAGTPGAVTTSFSHDPISSNVTSVTDPVGNVTTVSYDSVGNPLNMTDPLGSQYSFKYDSQGEPIAVTDPLGNTTRREYQNGQLFRVTDPLNRVVTRVTDGVGRPIAIIDPLGQTTKYQYNALGQITQIIGPFGNQTSYSYDGNGNTLTVTDALQHTNSFSYDVMDRLAAHSDPLGNSESVQRDLNGNISQFTDRRGVIATYTYDALNRPTSANFGGGQEIVNYTYDVGNRLTQVTDSISGNINRTYDNLNRLTQEVTPQGSISYGFDADGRRTSMAASGQAPVSYSYDIDSRLTQITQGASTVGFGYDSDSRRTSLTLPNGVTVAYTYDSASQLTGIDYNSGSKVLGNLAYTYDLNAQRVQVGGSFAQTGMPSAMSSATYNANNQLTSAGTGGLTYDASGNLTNDGVNRYTWDARNRLVSISGAIAANFQYDVFDRRVSTNIGGTKQYLYDGLNPVEELSGGTPSTNLLTSLEVDEYFQRIDANGPASFLSDALGSTIALADPNGNISSQYTYEPFGNTTISGNSANPFQYAGRENDPTSLYFYRARYYSPAFGRFISEDPIRFAGGDVNLYRYVWNSPTNFTDPLGEIGVGLDVGGNAEGGVAVVGAGAQGSAGGGVFVNTHNGSPSAGAFASGGAFAGGPKWGVSAPSKPGDINGVVGGYVGGGVSVWASNANNVCDLSGPFKTVSVQGGWFAKVGSAQFSWGRNSAGNLIGVLNWGIFPIPTGLGFGASASVYNTNTVTKGTGCGCS